MFITITIKITENIHVIVVFNYFFTCLPSSSSGRPPCPSCDVMHTIHLYATRGHYLFQRYLEINIVLKGTELSTKTSDIRSGCESILCTQFKKIIKRFYYVI
jgi:hypothetical protein